MPAKVFIRIRNFINVYIYIYISTNILRKEIILSRNRLIRYCKQKTKSTIYIGSI